MSTYACYSYIPNLRDRWIFFEHYHCVCRYRSGPANEATIAYAALAKKAKLSLTELSLLWCRGRKLPTTVLVGTATDIGHLKPLRCLAVMLYFVGSFFSPGHTSMKQLEESIRIFQSNQQLSRELMWEIDRVHMRNRLPIFASDRAGADWYGEGEIGERIP